MITNGRHYLAVQTGRDYVAVAQMVDQARRCGHDHRMRVLLEARANRRLELARRDVAADETGKHWAQADIAARQGRVRLVQGHAKDVVARIKEEQS